MEKWNDIWLSAKQSYKSWKKFSAQDETLAEFSILDVAVYNQGQTQVSSLKTGPSFQLQKQLHVCYALVLL